jgi:predicted transcriptional regulator
MSSVRREAAIIGKLEKLLTKKPQDVDQIAKHVEVSRTYVRQCLNLMTRWGMAKKQPRYHVRNRYTHEMRIVNEIDREAGDCLYSHYSPLYWKESK